MKYKKITKEDIISENIKNKEIYLTGIVMDIDGVLIDVNKSYNEAIRKTVHFITSKLKKSYARNLVNDEIILRFRQSGGFNNDMDTSYAISLALLSLHTSDKIDPKKFLLKIAENSNEKGIRSVEKFLKCYLNSDYSNKLANGFNGNIDKIKKYLDYPGPVGKSIVSTIFDEFFYGQKLFKSRYGFETNYYHGKPLIENEKIIITNKTIKYLSKKFDGRICMVSGRSKIAARFSLNNKFKLLNGHKSIFLEDEKRKYGKPNPYGLIKVINRMTTTNALLYCGDSFEDLIMARAAEKEINLKKKHNRKINILFCGVYGLSANHRELIKKFKENNAEIIIKNINNLPYILNKVDEKEC